MQLGFKIVKHILWFRRFSHESTAVLFCVIQDDRDWRLVWTHQKNMFMIVPPNVFQHSPNFGFPKSKILNRKALLSEIYSLVVLKCFEVFLWHIQLHKYGFPGVRKSRNHGNVALRSLTWQSRKVIRPKDTRIILPNFQTCYFHEINIKMALQIPTNRLIALFLPSIPTRTSLRRSSQSSMLRSLPDQFGRVS